MKVVAGIVPAKNPLSDISHLAALVRSWAVSWRDELNMLHEAAWSLHVQWTVMFLVVGYT